jgi:hypothetical protein
MLGSESISLSCHGLVDANYPSVDGVPVKFVVERLRRGMPGDRPEDGIKILSAADSETIWVPVPGVMFQPILMQGLAGDIGDRAVSDISDFAGIITPQEEWCTDTCGVGTINFVPRCKAENNLVVLGFSSGSLFSSSSINVAP